MMPATTCAAWHRSSSPSTKGATGDVLLTFRGEFTRFENPEDRNLGNRAPMDNFGGEIRGSKINGEDNGAIPPIDNGPLPF